MVSISQYVYKKVIYQIFRSFLLVVVFLLWELMIYIVIHLTELFIMSHRAKEVSNIIPQKPDWVKIRQNQFKFNFGDAEKRLLPCKNSTKENFFRFGRFGLKKSIDVTYCGLESGTVFERVTGVRADVFVVSIPNK